jgi:hypothetical protein
LTKHLAECSAGRLQGSPVTNQTSPFVHDCSGLLLLAQVSSPVSAAELSPNPLAMTADGNIFKQLWNKVPKAKPVMEDPYGEHCCCCCCCCWPLIYYLCTQNIAVHVCVERQPVVADLS